MNIIDIPKDLVKSPFEIVKDFIVEFNKATVSGAIDSMMIAREYLIRKYVVKEEPLEQKFFLQSEMKGCIQ